MLKNDPFENGSAGYHGYWGLDFTTVDPHLGTDQDFADLTAKAHALGLKVYLDVVVNHTADVVQLTGTSYTDIPYRDCHGKRFAPSRYVRRAFPCLKASTMPRVPFVLAGDRTPKKPAWLNDPLNYHDRGNIDFGSCSITCFEQGDFFGLDDLFTEKPSSRTASRRSTRRGSRASRSTASASTPPSTSTRRSSGSGCRRFARPRGRPASPTSRSSAR